MLLYEPIFLLKKAPVEVEVLLLTPTEIWCLAFIEEDEDAAYTGSNDNFWINGSGDSEDKVLNPAYQLKDGEDCDADFFVIRSRIANS